MLTYVKLLFGPRCRGELKRHLHSSAEPTRSSIAVRTLGAETHDGEERKKLLLRIGVALSVILATEVPGNKKSGSEGF
jgi:hypothetical protein